MNDDIEHINSVQTKEELLLKSSLILLPETEKEVEERIGNWKPHKEGLVCIFGKSFLFRKNLPPVELH